MEEQIIYKRDGSILKEGLANTFKEFVEKNKKDLTNANLRYANLRYADLSIFSKYNPFYYINLKNELIIKIGCEEKTMKEWDKWFKSSEEFETKRGTHDFVMIESHYLSLRAGLKHLMKNKALIGNIQFNRNGAKIIEKKEGK